MEDTYNLLGHALRKALSVIAHQQGRGLTEVANQAGATVVSGSSLKAALDLNWDDSEERTLALVLTLQALHQAEAWIAQQTLDEIPKVAQKVTQSLEAADQVKVQDVETTPEGTFNLGRGVAKQRRISIEDGEMRHGRKSRRQRVDGYKRHLLRDLDSGLIRTVGVTPANAPEASVTDAIQVDLEAQQAKLIELHIDRAYLSSTLVKNRGDELTIYCKAWPVRNQSGHLPKTAFSLDWQQGTLTCPNQVVVPLRVGKAARFPATACASCPLQQECTTSRSGRSVSIHPNEQFLQELRQRQLSPAGRAKLRERTAVEHSLAHVGYWQGDRARYLGLRKNLFDLRRMAVVHNLHVVARMPVRLQQETA